MSDHEYSGDRATGAAAQYRCNGRRPFTGELAAAPPTDLSARRQHYTYVGMDWVFKASLARLTLAISLAALAQSYFDWLAHRASALVRRHSASLHCPGTVLLSTLLGLLPVSATASFAPVGSFVYTFPNGQTFVPTQNAGDAALSSFIGQQALSGFMLNNAIVTLGAIGYVNDNFFSPTLRGLCRRSGTRTLMPHGQMPEKRWPD